MDGFANFVLSNILLAEIKLGDRDAASIPSVRDLKRMPDLPE